MRSFLFFFNDTATTEIYTLSLHDALPIFRRRDGTSHPCSASRWRARRAEASQSRHLRHPPYRARSEEHTSELQSPCNLVCRLLLEKNINDTQHSPTLHVLRIALHQCVPVP